MADYVYRGGRKKLAAELQAHSEELKKADRNRQQSGPLANSKGEWIGRIRGAKLHSAPHVAHKTDGASRTKRPGMREGSAGGCRPQRPVNSYCGRPPPLGARGRPLQHRACQMTWLRRAELSRCRAEAASARSDRPSSKALPALGDTRGSGSRGPSVSDSSGTTTAPGFGSAPVVQRVHGAGHPLPPRRTVSRTGP
ncbi:hypothetical protein J2W21_000037 [Sinomonas atrocyanea]|nr:hypothetical protein [Sinomonas atrocyanea]